MVNSYVVCGQYALPLCSLLYSEYVHLIVSTSVVMRSFIPQCGPNIVPSLVQLAITGADPKGRGYRSGYRTYKHLISVAPTGNKLVPSPNRTLDLANVTLLNRRRSDWVRASGNRTFRHFESKCECTYQSISEHHPFLYYVRVKLQHYLSQTYAYRAIPLIKDTPPMDDKYLGSDPRTDTIVLDHPWTDRKLPGPP